MGLPTDVFFYFILYFVSSKYDFNVYQRALYRNEMAYAHYFRFVSVKLVHFDFNINPYQNYLHAIVPIDPVNL